MLHEPNLSDVSPSSKKGTGHFPHRLIFLVTGLPKRRIWKQNWMSS